MTESNRNTVSRRASSPYTPITYTGDVIPFCQIPRWMGSKDGPSGDAVKLWIHLDGYQNLRDGPQPGRKYLADAMGWKLRKLDVVLAALQDAGLLTVTHQTGGNGRQAHSFYHRHWEPLPEDQRQRAGRMPRKAADPVVEFRNGGDRGIPQPSEILSLCSDTEVQLPVSASADADAETATANFEDSEPTVEKADDSLASRSGVLGASKSTAGIEGNTSTAKPKARIADGYRRAVAAKVDERRGGVDEHGWPIIRDDTGMREYTAEQIAVLEEEHRVDLRGSGQRLGAALDTALAALDGGYAARTGGWKAETIAGWAAQAWEAGGHVTTPTLMRLVGEMILRSRPWLAADVLDGTRNRKLTDSHAKGRISAIVKSAGSEAVRAAAQVLAAPDPFDVDAVGWDAVRWQRELAEQLHHYGDVDYLAPGWADRYAGFPDRLAAQVGT